MAKLPPWKASVADWSVVETKMRAETITPEEAAQTPGALLFSFSSKPTPTGGRPSQAHVAISLGNGRTIEAQSPATGVDTFEVGDRFQYGALLPEHLQSSRERWCL